MRVNCIVLCFAAARWRGRRVSFTRLRNRGGGCRAKRRHSRRPRRRYWSPRLNVRRRSAGSAVDWRCPNRRPSGPAAPCSSPPLSSQCRASTRPPNPPKSCARKPVARLRPGVHQRVRRARSFTIAHAVWPETGPQIGWFVGRAGPAPRRAVDPASTFAVPNRLWAMATHWIQAELAPKRSGMWVNGPSTRSANTVSMIAWRRLTT